MVSSSEVSGSSSKATTTIGGRPAAGSPAGAGRGGGLPPSGRTRAEAGETSRNRPTASSGAGAAIRSTRASGRARRYRTVAASAPAAAVAARGRPRSGVSCFPPGRPGRPAARPPRPRGPPGGRAGPASPADAPPAHRASGGTRATRAASSTRSPAPRRSRTRKSGLWPSTSRAGRARARPHRPDSSSSSGSSRRTAGRSMRTTRPAPAGGFLRRRAVADPLRAGRPLAVPLFGSGRRPQRRRWERGSKGGHQGQKASAARRCRYAGRPPGRGSRRSNGGFPGTGRPPSRSRWP